MTIEELNKILTLPKETENIEFKEAKNQFSILGKDGKNRNSLYAYCVAIGNSGGGKLIFGVSDKINSKTGLRDIVGTNAIQNLADAEGKIYHVLGRKIKVEEIEREDVKIQIVHIPSHPVGGSF